MVRTTSAAMDTPTQRQLRLMGGRSNPFQTLIALFVTALFFMLFQVSLYCTVFSSIGYRLSVSLGYYNFFISSLPRPFYSPNSTPVVDCSACYIFDEISKQN